MSTEARIWAKRHTLGNPTAKAVLLAIADFADEQGEAWPSQRALAELTEFKPRAVRAAIAFLQEARLLRCEERRRPDGGRTSDRILLDLSANPPAGGAKPPGTKCRTPRHDVPGAPAADAGQEPPLNLQGNHSDADASGRTGKPAEPFSVRDLLWRDGVLTLRGLGMADPAARRLIGKLLRDTGGDAGRIHWAIDEARAAETGDPIPYVTRLLNDTPTSGHQRRDQHQPRAAFQPAPTGQAARLATLFRQRQERTHASDPGTRDFVLIDGDLAGEPDDTGAGSGTGRGPARPPEANRGASDPLQRAFQTRAQHAAAQAALRRRGAP